MKKILLGMAFITIRCFVNFNRIKEISKVEVAYENKTT